MRAAHFLAALALVFYLPMSILAQGNWEWANPKPGGETYNDAFFIDDQTGWIVGQKGQILKTSDGGLSWIAQESGTEDPLQDICFLDALVGYTGGGFNVFKTEDGGAHWQKLALTTNGSINTLFFISKNKGWLATSNNYIYITEDGGQSWTFYYQGSPYAITSLYFTDEMTGFWLGFGGINKTTDGGKTFRLIFNAPMAWSYNRVSFISPTTAYILGDGGVIAKSIDTGESWTQVYKFVNVNVSNIYFKDEQNGCAVGGGIWTTNDGGITWKKVLETTGLYDVAFSGLSGCAVGYQGQIWATKDFGATWAPMHSDFIGFNDLTNVKLNDPQFGLLIGAGGSLFRTLDGGQSWTKLDLALDYWLKDMQIFDARTACIISGDKIYRFEFSGDGWEPHFTETAAAQKINRLFFLDSQTGWIAGRDILHTADGGKSWQVQTLSAQVEHQGICFTDALKGFAVGKYEGIYVTTNGGGSWQKKSLPTTVQMVQVKFVNPQVGFCLGYGVILKTIDSGANWQIRHQDSKLNLMDLVIVDAQRLIAIGGNYTGDGTELSTMLYSEDSGESWQKMAQPANRFLAGGFFLDRNKGWSCGSQATLLKYTDSIPLPSPAEALQASALDTTVQLEWQEASDNEDGFEILRSEVYSGSYQVIDSAAANTRQFVDRSTRAGRVYWYRVRSYNARGLSAWTREDSARTRSVPVVPLAAPMLIAPGDGAENLPRSLSLSWGAVSDAATYHLQVATDPLFTTLVYESPKTTSRNLVIGPLAYGETCYWRVAAQKNGIDGPWSQVWRFSTQGAAPSTPVLVTPVHLAVDVPVPAALDWQDAPYASSYRLQISLKLSFTPALIDTFVTGSACTIGNLEPQKTYFWRIYGINNFGASGWSTVFSFTTFAPMREWTRQNSGTDDFISSVHFPHHRHGWAVGNNGLLLHSRDGGKSWQQQANPTTDRLESVFFTSQSSGWAVGGIRGTVLHTDDGGLTWKKQIFANTNSQFMSNVFFADSLKGWIASSDGFYGTEDGGTTWKLLSGKDKAFNAFYCLTYTTIFAANSDGIVISTDGGFNWSLLQPGAFCYALQALDEDHIWYATQNGYWHSADGGVSWQEHAAPLLFTDVAFIDRKVGFLATEEKLVMSIDGGQTWHDQSTNLLAPALPGAWEIAFCASSDSLFGWSVGTFGTILRYAAPKGSFRFAPDLIAPVSPALNLPVQPMLSWSLVPGATGYRLQIASDPGFAVVELDSSTVTPHLQSPPLAWDKAFFWRVQALYGDESSLWTFPRRFVTGKKTGVEAAPAKNMEFALAQNFPNPFNAGTLVTYSLATASQVRLVLYDVQGHEVVVLVSGAKSAGEHTHRLDGSKLPAGIYLYRLVTPGQTVTRKMAIVK